MPMMFVSNQGLRKDEETRCLRQGRLVSWGSDADRKVARLQGDKSSPRPETWRGKPFSRRKGAVLCCHIERNDRRCNGQRAMPAEKRTGKMSMLICGCPIHMTLTDTSAHQRGTVQVHEGDCQVPRKLDCRFSAWRMRKVKVA